MKEPKPIDKTKKSNRRCINCEHFPMRTSCYKPRHCDLADRDIEYWNCCKAFEWAKSKRYVEQEGQ